VKATTAIAGKKYSQLIVWVKESCPGLHTMRSGFSQRKRILALPAMVRPCVHEKPIRKRKSAGLVSESEPARSWRKTLAMEVDNWG